MKKINYILILAITLSLLAIPQSAYAAKQKSKVNVDQQALKNYPEKYQDAIFVKELLKEYKSNTKDEVIAIALDMMKSTTADFSRHAIIGYNLTDKPIKIEFRELSKIKEDYREFDALGWKKGKTLYIFLNPKHADAPPAAIAALLAHEALHQDEYNSLAEETYAWTMEAAVWCEMIKIYPSMESEVHPLTTRENTLKQLFEKGNYTNRYIKKTVHSNTGYKDLPQTSPGFEDI